MYLNVFLGFWWMVKHQGGANNVLLHRSWAQFIGNSKYITYIQLNSSLFAVSYAWRVSSFLFKGVKVNLKNVRVLICSYGSVQNSVAFCNLFVRCLFQIFFLFPIMNVMIFKKIPVLLLKSNFSVLRQIFLGVINAGKGETPIKPRVFENDLMERACARWSCGLVVGIGDLAS